MEKINILYTISEFMFGSKTRQLIDLINGVNKDLFNIEVGAIDIGDEATDVVRSSKRFKL